MDVKIIRLSDIDRCPRRSLSAGHYRADGSCLCSGEQAEPGPCRPGAHRPLTALNPDIETCPVCGHAALIHDENGCYGCGPGEDKEHDN